MKLPLAYYGDAVLRKKGVRVDEINDDLRQLVNDMIETMQEHNGVGIAAPQVHKSLALFITFAPIRGADDKWHPGKLRVFINPKIISYSEEQCIYSEGCLSIPKVYGEICRPFKVTIQATDLDGNEFTEEFQDFEAHVVMHENDHINGVLFIDRIHGKARKELEPILKEIKKKYTK